MFRKILVPVDLTERHEQAVTMAGELARISAGEITLLHAIELIQGLSYEDEKEFYERLEQKAWTHLEQLGKPLAERQISWHAEVVYGSRAQEILRFALQSGSDLIVLTSHRIDVQHPEKGWGTLSYQLGILSQCPVLLVK
jgi:nucleotide-binding universal stress UspA family protein